MEDQNAFIGRKDLPSGAEITAALGPSADLWNQLLEWMAEQGVSIQDWQSISPKYGWAVRLKIKKRTIVYLGPCTGCFRASLVLGDRAIAVARQSELSQATLKLLDEAPRYAEGTGVRLMVKTAKDLVSVRKLALIEIAN